MEAKPFLQSQQLALNAQQTRAVGRVDGRTLLLAVPGSGKTAVIVAWLGYLIFGCGIPASSILTLSYNVAAVAELKRRFAAQFGTQTAPAFRTINGFCAKVLMAYAELTGRQPFALMDREAECTRLTRRVFFEQTGAWPSDVQLRSLQTAFSFARNSMLSDEEVRRLSMDSVDVPTLLRAYTAKKIELHRMDYDDQLDYAYRALRAQPALLARFRRQFPYVQLDEAQDASRLQHEIIRLLVGDTGSLLMVGDEDQSIYGFRAAAPDALFLFETRYPGGTVLPLEQNYRSTGALVAAADQLIRRNRDRHDKQMRTDRPDGEAPQRKILKSRAAQYEWLAGMAASCQEETAILYRNNDSALPLIDLLQARGIPFFCREHDALYLSHFMVTDCCAALRFARNPADEALFRELYYKFGCPISRNAMEQAIALHKSCPQRSLLTLLADRELCEASVSLRLRTLQRQLERAARMNSRDALDCLRNDTGFGRYLEGRKADAVRLDTLLLLAGQNPEPTHFLHRLEELRALIAGGSNTPGAHLTLSTIHSAKGLEFDRVILMDVCDGILPASVPGSDAPREEERRALEEERRLFYVGVTRAKNHLTVLDYESAHGKSDQPGLFLRELFGLTTPATSVSAVPAVASGTVCPFPPGTRVHHKLLGAGTVTACHPGTVTILFDTPYRSRTLDLGACLHAKLLQPECLPAPSAQ